MALRDYQHACVAAIREAASQVPRGAAVLLQAACGSGKTEIATELMELAVKKGRQALFLARGRELVTQTRRFCDIKGLPTGIIMRGHGVNAHAPIQIVSKDTLATWGKNRGFPYPTAHLLIVDECHNTGDSWDRIIDHYKGSGAFILGMTATPALPNGRPLPGYARMVQCIRREELIKMGYLVPCRVYAPHVPDFGKMKANGSDYSAQQGYKAMGDYKITGNIVEWWKRHGADRPTVCYCCTVEHAIDVERAFEAAGVRAGLVHGSTSDQDRERIFKDSLGGKVQVIVNVMVMKEGIDLPWLSCCIMARPTRSVVLAWQGVGRVCRPFTDKKDAVILDHSGFTYLHGHPDFEPPWSLDSSDTVQGRMKKGDNRSEVPTTLTCRNCKCVYPFAPTCPTCGIDSRYKRRRRVLVKDGVLIETQPGMMNEALQKQKEMYWKSCVYCAKAKGGRVAMARSMYHTKWLEFPSADMWPRFPPNWGGRFVSEAMESIKAAAGS